MLWGLRELKRRVIVTGPVRISKEELFLICGDSDGMHAVMADEVNEAVRVALKEEQLEAYMAGDEWFVAKID